MLLNVTTPTSFLIGADGKVAKTDKGFHMGATDFCNVAEVGCQIRSFLKLRPPVK
jgi:hypothetical protein